MAIQLTVFAAVSLALSVWNVVAALRTCRLRREIPPSVRWSAWLCVLALFPALVAWQQAFDIGVRSTWALPWLYPVLYLLGAWQCEHTPGRGRLWLAAYNLMIGTVLSLRLAEYALGDLGLLVASLQVAFTRLQMVSVMMMALWVQLPFYPPVLMMPVQTRASNRPTGRRDGWWLIPFIPSCILLIAWIALLPHGYAYSSDWRTIEPTAYRAHPAFQQGAVIRLSAKAFPDARWQKLWMQALWDGKLRAVNLFLDSDLAQSPSRMTEAVGLADRLRRQGLTVIITSDFTKEIILGRFTRTPQGLCDAMTPWSTQVLRAFRPTYFVPIIEPYGAAGVMLRNTPSPDDWHHALQKMFSHLRQQSPGTRLCVYFTPNEQDTALYKRCAASRVADVLGFSIYSLDEGPRIIRQRLHTMDRLVQTHGSGIEHWLFEYGHSPVTSGGERAQTGFHHLVTAHVAIRRAYRGACVFALDDREEKLGLLNAHGRRRPAFNALVRR